MKKYLFTIISSFFISVSWLYAEKGECSFNSDNMSATINVENGALVSFKNRITGWQMISDAKEGKSFVMNIKMKDGRRISIDGCKQPAPKVDLNSKQIVFVWDDLYIDNTKLPVSFTGKVIFNNDGLEYSGELTNNSDMVIEQLIWPCLGDVALPENTDKLLFQYISYSTMKTEEIYPDNGPMRGWCNLPETAFALLNNGRQGLYLSSKDVDLDQLVMCTYNIIPNGKYRLMAGGALSKKDNAERNNMNLQICAERMIYSQPNSSVELPAFVVKPYEGTWHKGADIYKEWKRTWYKPPYRPAWIEDVNSWQQLQINSSEDDVNFPYTQLVEYARDCKKYGVDAIQVTGWTKGGQDRGIPSHSTDPALGTFEQWKQAIAEANKMGVKIILFTKFTWVDLSSDLYDKYKGYIALNDRLDSCWHQGYNYNTYTQLMGINTRRFGVLCFEDAECRKYICEEFQKCLDLGAQGMVYDENQHHAGHMLCFNPNHGHKIPGFLYKGADLLGADFMKMVKQQDSNFIMFGEGCYDLQSKYYATYTRPNIDQIQVLRYVDPFLPMNAIVMWHNERNAINMCLMDRYAITYEPRNFKGRLSEFPRIMEYGRKVDNLRKKYKDYLWNAEFRDTQGAYAEGDDICYSVFVGKNGKKAVVVVNKNTKKVSKANVSVDDCVLSALTVVTPENPEPVKFSGSITLEPQSAAVIIEQ